MLLVVASTADEASVNIRDRLLEIGRWSEAGAFDGIPAWRCDDRLLVTIREHHLFVNDIDRAVAAALAVTADAVVYVSKHRAASGRDSLTVHPIGNWHAAEFGGKPGTVVPSAPGLMTDALRRVAAGSRALGYAVAFEATHHGPYLETPTFYIEVGSSPASWADPRAAAVLARAVLEVTDPADPVAIGIGGGHYMPRVTDVALSRRLSFGHLIPTHALEPPNLAAVEAAIDCTPRAKYVYFHRKALPKPRLRELEAFFRDRGLEPVREAELPARPGLLPESL